VWEGRRGWLEAKDVVNTSRYRNSARCSRERNERGMPVDKWRTMLSRPQNQHDWLIYILFVVLAVAGLALLVLDLGYGYAYVGIVWRYCWRWLSSRLLAAG